MPDLGIDATYWINGKDIADSGYKFIGRYILEGNYQIDADEVTNYHANGLGIEFFGEHQANFMLGGGPAGTAAGQNAHDNLRNLGAPAGTGAFFTCDFDAQPNQFPALGAFLSAADIQMGEYRAGVYGGIKVVDAFHSAYLTHQTEAWSGGRVSDNANFYQRVGTTLPPIAGTQPGSYDEDIALNPAGLWGPSAPPAPPQSSDVTDEDAMLIINRTTGDAAILFGNHRPRKIASVNDYQKGTFVTLDNDAYMQYWNDALKLYEAASK